MTDPERHAAFIPLRDALLLKAALLSGEEALQAWADWTAQGTIEEIDGGLHPLLPILYYNLQRLGVTDHPSMGKLAGVCRRAWYVNQLALNKTTTILETFRTAGLPGILLGDAALSLQIYPEQRLRPIRNIEVYMPMSQLGAVERLLDTLGWAHLPDHGEEPAPTSFPALTLAWGSYRTYRGTDEQRLRLWWHVIPELPLAKYDEAFQARAVSAASGSNAVTVLEQSDQLLHTILSAARSPSGFLVRLADAAMIAQRAGEIDWSRVAGLAQAAGLAYPAGEFLKQLSTLLDVPIPRDIPDRLMATPLSTIERYERTGLARPAVRRRLCDRFWLVYMPFRRTAQSQRRSLNCNTFAEYLQYRWGLAQKWQIPLHAVKQLLPRRRKKGKT